MNKLQLIIGRTMMAKLGDKLRECADLIGDYEAPPRPTTARECELVRSYMGHIGELFYLVHRAREITGETTTTIIALNGEISKRN